MPTLTDLVNAIPTAGRGDVITPETHNTLRSALAAIVSQLGTSTPAQNLAPTFAPVFLPITATSNSAPAWVFGPGFARNPSTRASGWLPVQLPQGARIQNLVVQAGRNGPIEGLQQMDVTLQRQPLRNAPTSGTILATASLIGAANERDPFEISTPFLTSSFTGSAISEAQIVNNTDYKYFVRADLDVDSTTANVFLYGIRIECQSV